MNVRISDLKNLPVYTQSNQLLGKIDDVEIEGQSQQISRYIVTSSQLVKRLTAQKLIINSTQVISIDDKKMIVEDGVIKERKLVKGAVSVN